MKTISCISDIPKVVSPIALSIGVFDGVHIGHQSIINKLHQKTRKQGTRVILTFSNHPSDILTPNTPTPLISSFSHKLHMLEEFGIDLTIALSFSHAFSEQNHEDFLISLFNKLPFDFLILGKGATFGKNRLGNENSLKKISQKMKFEIDFLKKEHSYKELISSNCIRKLIEKGSLKKVKKLLGRPFSIRVPFNPEEVTRYNETLYQWLFHCRGLCLLPSGVYAVDIKGKEKKNAIAFLNGSTMLNKQTSLNVTLYFESMPSHSNELTLYFVGYMHDTLNLDSYKASVPLKTLFPEPTFS